MRFWQVPEQPYPDLFQFCGFFRQGLFRLLPQCKVLQGFLLQFALRYLLYNLPDSCLCCVQVNQVFFNESFLLLCHSCHPATPPFKASKTHKKFSRVVGVHRPVFHSAMSTPPGKRKNQQGTMFPLIFHFIIISGSSLNSIGFIG